MATKGVELGVGGLRAGSMHYITLRSEQPSKVIPIEIAADTRNQNHQTKDAK